MNAPAEREERNGETICASRLVFRLYENDENRVRTNEDGAQDDERHDRLQRGSEQLLLILRRRMGRWKTRDGQSRYEHGSHAHLTSHVSILGFYVQQVIGLTGPIAHERFEVNKVVGTG